MNLINDYELKNIENTVLQAVNKILTECNYRLNYFDYLLMKLVLMCCIILKRKARYDRKQKPGLIKTELS